MKSAPARRIPNAAISRRKPHEPEIQTAEDLAAEEDGEQGKELIIRFEYRTATLTDWSEEELDGKKRPPLQKGLSAVAATRVMAVTDGSLASWITDLGKPYVRASGEKTDDT